LPNTNYQPTGLGRGNMPRRVMKGETCFGGLFGSGQGRLAIKALLVKSWGWLGYMRGETCPTGSSLGCSTSS